MAISSLGVGSGIDIRGLVDQLVAAERAPVQNRLDRKETQLQAELSAMGSLKGALNDFRTKVQSLSAASDFRVMKASSSKSDAVSVSASSAAHAGRYDVDVNTLATSQSLASQSFSSPADSVASGGKLTFRFGAVTTDGGGQVTGFNQNADRAVEVVDIPATGTSLTAIRDAVNEAEIGVQASIINDGSGERLVFQAQDAGAANGFVVEVDDDDGNDTDSAGLSQLAFNASAAHQAHTREAQDAELTVNGLSVSRSSNVIDDLVEGVTFTLNETTAAAAEVTVASDVSAVRKKIEGFVDGFNALQDQIEQIAGYDAETKQSGVLQGNAAVRTINSNLRQLVTERLDVLGERDVRALVDLGITTNRNGRLEIDSARLDEALADNFDEVGALFGVTGLVDGGGLRYESSRSATTAGEYAVAISQLAEPASVTSTRDLSPSQATPFTIDADNDALTLTVDGVTSDAITLTHGNYSSGAALAAELQARINGDDNFQSEGVSVEVGFSGNRLVITSSRYGSESQVDIASVDNTTSSTLGLNTTLNDTGVDVAGTIGGAAAEGFGRYLTAQSGSPEGLKLEITGSQTGNLGSVTFSRGITDALEDALDSYLKSDSVLASTTDRLESRIDGIGEDRLRLAQRLSRIEERYVSQFSAMDALVAELNQTGDFLGTQLAALENLSASAGKQKS